ncbi:uncharacterized protein LOC144175952 [Haemaphysalis longicornis]
MKAVFALAFFAVVGIAYAQDGICSLPAESRHEVVECLRGSRGQLTLAALRHLQTVLLCEDIDCVLTRSCELSNDPHAQHAYSPRLRKAALRAAFAQCVGTSSTPTEGLLRRVTSQ